MFRQAFYCDIAHKNESDGAYDVTVQTLYRGENSLFLLLGNCADGVFFVLNFLVQGNGAYSWSENNFQASQKDWEMGENFKTRK